MLFNFTIFFVNVFPGESLGFGRMVHFPLLVYFSSVSVIISCYSFRIVLWWHNNDEESIAKSKLENKTINSYFLWNKRRDNLLVVAKHCSYTGTVLQHLKMFGTVTHCCLGLPRSDRNLSENGTCHHAARVLHWLRLALSCWIILPFIHLGVNLNFPLSVFFPLLVISCPWLFISFHRAWELPCLAVNAFWTEIIEYLSLWTVFNKCLVNEWKRHSTCD